MQLLREVCGLPDDEPVKGRTRMHMCGVERTKAEKAAGWGRDVHSIEVKGPTGTAFLIESGRHREVQWSDDGEDRAVHFVYDPEAEAWAEEAEDG